MSLLSKLTHRITVTSTGPLDDNGQVTAGTPVTNQRCFIDGRMRRVVNEKGDEVQADYSILFLPSTDIQVGYSVSAGVDARGTSLLTSGLIVGVEDSNHPKRGRVVREAFVQRKV